MIKFVFRTLFLLTAAAIILAALYVFELPPFSAPADKTTEDQQLAAITDQSNSTPPTDNDDSTTTPKVERNKTLEEMMSRARELEQNGFPSLAIAQYQEAYKKDTSNLEPLLEMGKIYLRTSNYGKAEEIFQLLITKDPQNSEAQIFLGRAFLGERKISEAQKIFNALTVQSQAAKYYQGIVAAYFSDHERAKELLNQSVSLGGNDDLTKKANNFLSAYNEYRMSTESPTIYLKVLLARSFNQCGEYEMAIGLLFEVTKEKLDYRDAWILLGYAYLQTNKYQDAIEALERAKILDDQKAETFFYLGLAYYNVNNFKLAEEALLKAKEMRFEPQILVDQKLAEVYLELKNYPLSAENYEKVLALNSQDVNYYIRPIYIYLEQLHQPEKALALAQKATNDHPNQAMAQNLMGWALIFNNDLDKAEAHLKLAMALDSALDATYLNFGILYEKKNEPDKALLFYKKAHTLGQGNGIAASAATHYNHLLATLDASSAKSLQANLLAP